MTDHKKTMRYAVVYFDNGSDQTIYYGVGTFTSEAKAEKARDVLEDELHEGACPQIVTLLTLKEVLAR